MTYVAISIFALILGIMLASWADVTLQWLHERQLAREVLTIADTLYPHEADPKLRLWICINDLCAPDGIFGDRSERERQDLIRAAHQTLDTLDRVKQRYIDILSTSYIDGKAPSPDGPEPQFKLTGGRQC